MVAVAYRRWSFTTGSNCRALTGNALVFWIGGRLWEVVAYEKWSHMEVRLLLNATFLVQLRQIIRIKYQFCNPYITSYARLTCMQWLFKNTSNSCRVPVYKVHFIMTTVINLHPENKSERRSIICLLHIEPIKFACNINTLH